MKIKTGDKIKVLAGKDKGKTGTVYRAFPKRDQVLIEGINLVTKHQKSGRVRSQGQVIEKPMPIHVSNVALLESDKPVRAGYQVEAGKKTRVSRRSGKKI